MTATIPIYVIYDHPKDYPNHWAVRMQTPVGGGKILFDRNVFLFETLEAARAALPPGLTHIPREEADDPKIFESWL